MPARLFLGPAGEAVAGALDVVSGSTEELEVFAAVALPVDGRRRDYTSEPAAVSGAVSQAGAISGLS